MERKEVTPATVVEMVQDYKDLADSTHDEALDTVASFLGWTIREVRAAILKHNLTKGK